MFSGNGYFCKFLSFLFRVGLALLIAGMPVVPVDMVAEAESFAEIHMVVGDLYTVDAKGVTKVSVTDPDIADISEAKADSVTVTALSKGQTTLFIWDGNGKNTVVVRVIPEDLTLLRARMESLLESAGITGIQLSENIQQGVVVVSGDLLKEKMPMLEKVLDQFDEAVVNLVKEKISEDMVQIDMQITELSTTLTKELGIDWRTGTQSVNATGQYTTTFGDSFTPIGLELMPSQNGGLDMFKVGEFYRAANSALVAKVNALIREGKAQVLSKPRLVVKSGMEASFLVGGEVPIRSSTIVSGGTSTEAVSFKEYGVNLIMTPTIKNGKVDILLNVEISDLDKANYQGNDVAFVTRSASTHLNLDDRQTIVLAGLIKKNKGWQKEKVPFFGSIPLIGLLFRSTKTPTPDAETEVVISITPTVIPGGTTGKSGNAAVVEPRLQSVSDESAAESSPALGVVRDTSGKAAIRSAMKIIPVTVAPELAPYARVIQERISGAIAYPVQAQENGWQGTVKLLLVLRRDGSVREAMIRDSSGYEVIDRDAVNTARLLAPYPVIPINIKGEELALTIPIVYSLHN